MLTKVHIVKAMAFPVVMYGCESWTIKKAEHQRINAFELWCWRRLFRVLWTARRSKQLILKEINREYSLEGLMKLKLKYPGNLMWKSDSLEKILILRRSWWQKWVDRMRRLDDIIDTMDMSLNKLREIEKDKEAWHAVVHGVTKSWTRTTSDWTTVTTFSKINYERSKLNDRALLEICHCYKEIRKKQATPNPKPCTNNNKHSFSPPAS